MAGGRRAGNPPRRPNHSPRAKIRNRLQNMRPIKGPKGTGHSPVPGCVMWGASKGLGLSDGAWLFCSVTPGRTDLEGKRCRTCSNYQGGLSGVACIFKLFAL